MPEPTERLLPGVAAPATKRGWFRRKAPAAPKPAVPSRKSDLAVAALGLLLGLTCAMFPWYIFFNQDKFTLEGMALHIVPGFGSGPATVSPDTPRGRPDKPAPLVPLEQLDLFATGTTPHEEPKPPAPEEQPLPPPLIRFHVVHIENGRAMIEDDSGLFVVGRGDLLPDGSRVARIETRDGRAVLVTSENKRLAPES